VTELPETVQGIIAARLDALSEREKLLLQDAAVAGKVFWLGAVEAVGSVPRWQAEELLHSLERKEFVQRARASSVGSETEYAFRHVLIRDVAYGQIPRAARSAKHERVASWIESLGRPEEQAEMLAHHYLQALELAEAAGLDSPTLRTSARKALRDAGDRAAALSLGEAAVRFYEAALELYPEEGPERADLLFRRAVPVGHHVAGGNLDHLAEARDALLNSGDRTRAGEAEALIAQAYWIQGRTESSDECMHRALELVADGGATRSRAWVLIRAASRSTLVGNHDEGLAMASEALAVSEALGWDGGMSEALNLLGIERAYGGDPGALADIERSVALARRSGAAGTLTRALNTLSVVNQVGGDLQAAYAARIESARTAVRTGSDSLTRWFDGSLSDHLYRRGEWDEALDRAERFLAAVEHGTPNVIAWQAYGIRAEIRRARGDVAGAQTDAEQALTRAREVDEVQAVSFALALAAHVLSSSSAEDRARPFADELIETLDAGVHMQFAVVNLPLFAAAAHRLGLAEDLARAVEHHPPSPWTEVVHAYATRRFPAAADLLATIGSKPDEAEARLFAAEALAAAGREAGADEQRRQALDFYRSVGAAV
jgi:tetratricopeptide (TPR) repeat protein